MSSLNMRALAGLIVSCLLTLLDNNKFLGEMMLFLSGVFFYERKWRESRSEAGEQLGLGVEIYGLIWVNLTCKKEGKYRMK